MGLPFYAETPAAAKWENGIILNYCINDRVYENKLLFTRTAREGFVNVSVL